MPGGGHDHRGDQQLQSAGPYGSRLGNSNGASLPCALFVVADTGLGMDSKTQAHLFEAFLHD